MRTKHPQKKKKKKRFAKIQDIFTIIRLLAARQHAETQCIPSVLFYFIVSGRILDWVSSPSQEEQI